MKIVSFQYSEMMYLAECEDGKIIEVPVDKIQGSVHLGSELTYVEEIDRYIVKGETQCEHCGSDQIGK